MKRRILFVDDEPNVLQGLQRMLRSMRNEWDMHFAGSGEEALSKLEEAPFDVIVSDMRMPGMNGAQLLREVARRYPNVVRIVLSGHSDREYILQLVTTTHQYLAKPCEAETIKDTVNRACALRDLLTSKELSAVVSRIKSLPSLPSLYMRIIEVLQSDDPSLQKIGEIVSEDIAMSAKVLQLVNSSFFGIARRISNPVQAVMFLGLETVKALVLSVQIFAKWEHSKVQGFDIERLWHHSMTVGAMAKRLAETEQLSAREADEAFTAGLLHDVGKLILAASLPDTYQKVLAASKAQRIPLWRAEEAVFGTSHAEVGAYLLGLWGLPTSIVEAVAWHHRPSLCPARTFCPLTTVHVANALWHQNIPEQQEDAPQTLDTMLMESMGLTERLPAWQSVYAQVITQGGK
ncbi:MAG: two-component system response regulator [Armatimonadota bacterium]|nr:MAG: two-component system response regulator [Armatimonadota bacterium]